MANKMIERLKEGPRPGTTIFRAVHAITFSFRYDDESGGVYGIDQGGFLMTKDELKDLIEGAGIFFEHYGNEAVEEHNAEAEQRHRERRRKEDEAEKPKLAVSGYVYLIRAENGLYKIGKTKNISRRMQPFSVSFPMKWELIHSFKSNDYDAAEGGLHNTFAEKRDVGEWFKLLPEDVEFIKSLEDGML